MPRFWRKAALQMLTVAAAVGSAPAGHAARCTATAPEVVCLEQGAVRGVVEGETLAFKGIPYAHPPIGAMRWRPPAPPAAWPGVRDGSHFGPVCLQLFGKEVAGSEDCLYVNVWRPRRTPDRLLPVMIWLTGGGNHALSGEGSAGFGGVAYNGGKLVPEGVVFVSYNLRLGVLGFLAHPALDVEWSERISGNYGSLDQIAMLRWVKRNIRAFGGDPARVFLFGTSAGGGNICALLTSPLTRGLFAGAAMESSVPMGCEIQTLADAEAGTGRRIAAAVGCDKAVDIAACLREKPARQLVAALPGSFTIFPRVYGPNMDGHIFPDQPLKRIAQRKYSAMPVIIGNTAEETMRFIDALGPITDAASFAGAVEKLFGAEQRERIVAAYPLGAYETPRQAFVHLTTDGEFTCQSRRVARAFFAAQNRQVYRFLFAHALENDPAQNVQGAIHTVEHPFFFAWEGKYRPTVTDLAIQRQMIGYWTRMAKTGDPNGGGAPLWQAYTPESDAYLEIGAHTESKRGPAAAQCDFWDTIKFPWPHL